MRQQSALHYQLNRSVPCSPSSESVHSKMSFVINFKFLQKLVNYITKFSGFLFISMDFDSFDKLTVTKSWIYTVVSFAWSFLAVTFSTQFQLATLTHSELLEMGVNFFIKSSLWAQLLLKVLYLAKAKCYLAIVKNYQWCYLKVRTFELSNLLEISCC